MRLRKIPAATRKACRPTPAWVVAAGAPSGLVGFVTVVLVPSSFLFINENAVLRRVKYSLRQCSEPPLYWAIDERRAPSAERRTPKAERRTPTVDRRTEGESLMRRLTTLGLFLITVFLC